MSYQGLTTEQIQKKSTDDLLSIHTLIHKKFKCKELDQHKDSTSKMNLLIHQELSDRGLILKKVGDDLDQLSQEHLKPKISHKDPIVKFCPIVKAEQAEQIVLGVVLEPNTVDTQGDTLTEETIRLAAHKWLAKFQHRGLMHEKTINTKVEIYESYIALTSFKIGSKKIKKGTWLLMYHILDKKLWKKIKDGELTGFSIGGDGSREEIK